MKRDHRLQGLSSDHHHALVLARRLEQAGDSGLPSAELVAEVRARFEAELAPHFAVEEELLLPRLARAGGDDLVARTLAEHQTLRAELAAAERGDAGALVRFGRQLAEHVRFEERVLLPACEERLPPEALDAVAARAPKHSP